MRLPDDSSLPQVWTMIFAFESYEKNSRNRLPILAPRQMVRSAYLGRVAQLSGLRLDFVMKFYYRVNFRGKSISSSS